MDYRKRVEFIAEAYLNHEYGDVVNALNELPPTKAAMTILGVRKEIDTLGNHFVTDFERWCRENL